MLYLARLYKMTAVAESTSVFAILSAMQQRSKQVGAEHDTHMIPASKFFFSGLRTTSRLFFSLCKIKYKMMEGSFWSTGGGIAIIVIVCVILAIIVIGLAVAASQSSNARHNREMFAAAPTPGTASLYSFENQLARERFRSLYEEYGKPMILADQPGGIVVWKRPGEFLHEIVLKDESVQHLEPKPHCDFLYASVQVHIPDEALPAVLMLSKSVMYDRLKQVLTARCHFMGASVATLLLGLRIAERPKKADKLYSSYGEHIMKSMSKEGYRDLYAALKSAVESNRSAHSGKIPEDLHGCTMEDPQVHL